MRSFTVLVGLFLLLSGCSGETAGPNRLPVAIAGKDQQVVAGETATLDGSSSFDPDGDDLTYSWELVAAPQGAGQSFGPQKGVTVEFEPAVAGVWMVRLVVSDGKLLSEPDVVLVRAGGKICTSDQECNDGLFCTEPDSCTDGVCENPPRDCSALDNQCNRGECDEELDQCVAQAINAGDACDDGLYCTQGETCQAGSCAGGTQKNCDDGYACTDDSCDEASDICRNPLVPNPGAEGPWDDATCSDGQDNDCDRLVDVQDPECLQCQSDSDCADTNPCTQNTCDSEHRCQTTPAQDGTPCDDGQYCTDPDTCTTGVCSGSLRDCSAMSGPCSQGVCNSTAEQCEAQAINEGNICDDGLYCNVNETCQSGSCTGGGTRVCSVISEQCKIGWCDEAHDQCDEQNRQDGTMCDDGDPCSSQDACSSGACVSGPTDKDTDGDGYYDDQCPDGDDCADGVFGINPGAAEDCQDGVDNNCDGLTDAEDPYRKVITIDHNRVAGSSGSLAAFPVLVHIHDDADLRGHVASANGYDLNFRDQNGGNRLDHEIEAYDPGSGTLVAWVRIPVVQKGSDKVITMYYGNTCSGPSSSNPTGVWDTRYQGVWHLSEVVNDEQNNGTHYDSTSHGNHGSQENNNDTTGKIANGQDFDGNGDYIDIANPGTFQLGNASCTISAWINTSSGSDMGIVIKGPFDSHVSDDKLFGVNHTSDRLGIDQGWVTYLAGTSDIIGNGWHHVVWTQKRDDSGGDELWTLYVDGSYENSLHAGTNSDPAGHTLRIGCRSPGSYFSNRFNGSIDEVRISHTDRSVDWIGTSFNNQNWPDKARFPAIGFFSVGTEEPGD